MSALPEYPYRAPSLVLADGDLAVLDCRGSHLCGYCAFPDEKIPEDWRGNYDAPGLQFLAIHGGLTYAESADGRSVFGFDCMHSGDSENPDLRDPQHVLNLARQMREQIKTFAERYPEWLAADREGRCAILDSIREQGSLEAPWGLGVMISMLCGAPELGDRP